MKAIIIMGHGSRVPGSGDGMKRTGEIMKNKYLLEIVETCHFSRAKPDFSDALAECVRRGADEVTVIPYFLYTGVHVREDIPEMMREEGKKYPGVKLVCGPPLGADELLADLVYKRAEEARGLPDVRNVSDE